MKNFEFISKEVGLPIEFTQGGGGNTSVKLNDELMAVKASGYKLKQISPSEGYVVVNYKIIFDYYKQVKLNQEKDFEIESWFSFSLAKICDSHSSSVCQSHLLLSKRQRAYGSDIF